MESIFCLTHAQLAVLATALEQFIQNQPELDDGERADPDVAIAQALSDAVEAERLRLCGER